MDLDLLQVAGNDPDQRAKTIYVMKRIIGSEEGPMVLLGATDVVPNAGQLRALAGEFAFSARVSRGTVTAEQIVIVDNLGATITPRSVVVHPMTTTGVHGARGA